jgi:uncharacterized protein
MQPDRGLDPRDVARFLRRNPAWLAGQSELWRVLEPPRRVYGERVADHMAAMLAAERGHAAAMAARSSAVTALASRIQAAVLALIAARDPVDCAIHEWPGLLGLDAVAFCAEDTESGARLLPSGMVQQLLGAAPALVRSGSADPLLHGEASALARVEALVAVPIGRPALLALACRDGRALTPEGTGSLAFLGRALAAALSRA